MDLFLPYRALDLMRRHARGEPRHRAGVTQERTLAAVGSRLS
jgi:hypothetical protein